MNTLEYFEDYSLKRDAACPALAYSEGGRLAKRAVYGWALVRFLTDWNLIISGKNVKKKRVD